MTRALIAVRTRLVSTDRESGATAVEYGLMVSLIAVAIIGTVTILGTTLSGLFATVTASL
jgi:pilus assembly protein Flp/PilA